MGQHRGIFPMLSLPDELLCKILSHIPQHNMLWCCLVCKKFLCLLFDLNRGVFEFNISDRNTVQSVLDCKEISSIITHLIIAHPHDSVDSCVKKIESPGDKGIFYKPKYLYKVSDKS